MAENQHSLSQSDVVPAPVADDVKGPHPEGAHAVPRRILLGVYAILLVLTGVTVGVSYVDLGPLNIVVALAVAVVKAAFVALFFMHLFWDSKFNSIILVAAFLFVALFIGFATLDTQHYQPMMTPPQSAHLPAE